MEGVTGIQCPSCERPTYTRGEWHGTTHVCPKWSQHKCQTESREPRVLVHSTFLKPVSGVGDEAKRPPRVLPLFEHRMG